jgi:hypothetical protein
VPNWTPLRASALVAQRQWVINEYHDEQKLTNPSGTKYGPLAGLSGSPDLQTNTLADYDAAGDAGLWVAVVDVDSAGTMPMLPEYTHLHLALGRHCVILAHTAGAANDAGWKGYVFKQTDPQCTRSTPPPAAAELDVIAEQYGASSTAADYPPVVRWDEAQNNHPVIGVRCALAWCELGPNGFAKRPPKHFTNPSGNLPHGREADVKGWHDEQRLAVLNAGGHPIPGAMYATAVPIPGLDATNEATFADWKQIATIWLPSNPPGGSEYADKWHLQPGENVLEMKATSPTTWLARLRNNPNANLVVIREDHAGSYVPGTARWRWKDSDEVLWVRCSTGCCSVSPQ